jgi:hypothetical protein
MSDFSDSDSNSDLDKHTLNIEEDPMDNDEKNDIIERIFDLSIRLQEYCRNQGLPIFNESQTTAIILNMY